MAPIVAFNSSYGSTQRYAEEFAARHGATAVALEDAEALLTEFPSEPVIVFSPVYGGMSKGAKWLVKNDVSNRKAALVSVGFSDAEEAAAKDSQGQSLGSKRDSITRFYVEGALDYSKLKFMHKTGLKMLASGLKKKPNRDRSEERILETYGKATDLVNFDSLNPVDAWLGA